MAHFLGVSLCIRFVILLSIYDSCWPNENNYLIPVYNTQKCRKFRSKFVSNTIEEGTRSIFD